MLDASKKTFSGAICEALGISDARQKATSARHLVAAWKNTTLAHDNQPPPDRPGRPLTAHYGVHRVRCQSDGLPNLPRTE